MQDATEFYVETVGGHSGRSNRGGVGFPGGDGHDLGLRVPVVAYVVGHHGDRGPGAAIVAATVLRALVKAVAVAVIVFVVVVVVAV